VSLISVIIPCYKVARFAPEAVHSVLVQKGVEAKVIVVDDGSPDDIRGALGGLMDDEKVIYRRKKNGGIASARNEGFRLISPETEFVYFLDGDDYLKPGALAEMSAYLSANPDVGMVHCIPEPVNEDGAALLSDLRVTRWAFGPRELKNNEKVTRFESIYCLAWIIPSSTMIRASVLREVGEYDENFGHNCEDTDLFLRIALKYLVHFIPEKLVCYRLRTGQASADRKILDRQAGKLYSKWLHDQWLTETEQALVRSSEYFRLNNLPVAEGLWHAKRFWSRGKYLQAFRFWQGALRRWGLRQFRPQRRVL
jgi:glycosyltransferase involved in cell wall biosynthesis